MYSRSRKLCQSHGVVIRISSFKPHSETTSRIQRPQHQHSAYLISLAATSNQQISKFRSVKTTNNPFKPTLPSHTRSQIQCPREHTTKRNKTDADSSEIIQLPLHFFYYQGSSWFAIAAVSTIRYVVCWSFAGGCFGAPPLFYFVRLLNFQH